MRIKTVADFYRALLAGPYAWPGGYPCYWLMADGEACAFHVGFDEAKQMVEAIQEGPRVNDQWRPVALEINWEDSALFCAHTGEQIESPYGDDGEEVA